ncbi:MAG: cysteine desulfurase [Candidatus Kapaibacterium sp.]|nr:MAG: cysteine desulfurase [Candidatus Kapabacteria bacterium]
MNTATALDFNVESIRAEFPILQEKVHGKPLIYLDNANTSQKPRSVVETIDRYYRVMNSNVHRGNHFLSQQATSALEASRRAVQAFINAEEEREIIFVRGTTEAINLVASSYGDFAVNVGDEILISAMEHHSNIVPWQLLCARKNAVLKVIPVNDAGELDMEAFANLLSERTRLLAITHISNTLGTINPVKEMIATAHEYNVPVLIDGAQAVPHERVDVQDLDADFYVFSGHKLFAPTGIGVLYGKAEWLEKMPPYHGGGAMISSVTFEKTTYNELPFKFEAGTPHIEGIIGLGAAIAYVLRVGLENIAEYEQELLAYGTQALMELRGASSTAPAVRIIGTAPKKASVISFMLQDGSGADIHPHDVGTLLDNDGIAIRTGHHCTQPLMKRFGVPATCRASFAFYNTTAEIDALVRGLAKVQKIFAV